MKYFKSFLLISVLLIFGLSSLIYARGKTPSILDKPEEGLYYISVINMSSDIQEIQIYSIDDDYERIVKNIFLDPWPSSNSSFSIHLKLGSYYLMSKRKDANIDEISSIKFILDENYIKYAPGPMRIKIVDERVR